MLSIGNPLDPPAPLEMDRIVGAIAADPSPSPLQKHPFQVNERGSHNTPCKHKNNATKHTLHYSPCKHDHPNHQHQLAEPPPTPEHHSPPSTSLQNHHLPQKEQMQPQQHSM
jgi:hypothetical protein